jgi:alpha-beta hydrolase superfamily lysophospholipase
VGELEAVIVQARQVPAVDGYDLAATVFQPVHGARDWVIVSGAFAVAARFYARYATALAEAGFGAVTYDYRGIGWCRSDGLVAGQRPSSAGRGGTTTAGAGRAAAKRARKQRVTKLSYDAIKVLQRVWAASGGQCGKYLAVSMRTQLYWAGTPRRARVR